MSEPILVLNKKIVDAVSMGSTITSAVIDISTVMGIAVHSIYTGTPTGSLIVQVSNDGVDFLDLNTVALAGSAGHSGYNIDGLHYVYARFKYTFTSGTGTLTTYMSGKRY